MNALPKTILQQARCLPEGGVLSPKEFLHLGSRSAVDEAATHAVVQVLKGRKLTPTQSWPVAWSKRHTPRG